MVKRIAGRTMQEHEDLDSFMGSVMRGETSDPFYHYEPWDPPVLAGDLPSKGFQIAYHMSTALLRLALAGNRVGKTLSQAIEAIVMMTGEIPFSMRVPAGFQTTIARVWENTGRDSIGMTNRYRHGFLNPEDGSWTPPICEPEMLCPEDRTIEAPCGFIKGVGVFPVKKISHTPNDSVWICTYKSVRDERWIKMLADLVPQQYLDRRRSLTGYSTAKEKFVLTNGNSLTFITYERGAERAQGANIFAVFLDEEPRNRKFWTEIDQRLLTAGFDGYMSMSYTPLLGLSWSWYDMVKPMLAGDLKEIDLFHATQYDSPLLTDEMIERRKRRYKPWEIKARIHGRFSEMTGRPYYDFIKLNGDEDRPGWIQRHIGRFVWKNIYPVKHPKHLSDGLGDPMLMQDLANADMEEIRGAWEVYELDKFDDCAYFCSVDTAEGAENVEEAIDRSVAYVFREPRAQENEEWPILVAALRTELPTMTFARLVWYGLGYFNNATLIPEVRGTSGGSLAAELRDWPFVYRMTVINDKTRKPKAKWGFDTTARTRQVVFDLVGDFINAHENPSCFRHRMLLDECAALVYGKKGRPDHPKHGTSDCIVAFGMALYVYRLDRGQLSNNRAALGKILQNRETDAFARYREKKVDRRKLPFRARTGRGATNGIHSSLMR